MASARSSSPHSRTLSSLHRSSRRGRIAVPLAAALLLVVAALPAAAQPSRASSAYGESINLRLVPLLGSLPAITSGPQPAAAGNGPAAYDRYTEIANLNVTTPLTGSVLTAAIVGVHAAGGAGPNDSVTADATITNPGLRLVGALPLLTLTSTEIGSSATVGDLCSNARNATGTSDLVNARLGGRLGIIPIPLSPAPNTVLLDQLGVKITLDEQILVVSGRTTTLTDAMPPQVVLQGYSPSRGSCALAEALVCHLGDLGAGESATVVISVYAPASGTVVNTASAATTSPELHLANNLASATVTARPPLPI